MCVVGLFDGVGPERLQAQFAMLEEEHPSRRFLAQFLYTPGSICPDPSARGDDRVVRRP